MPAGGDHYQDSAVVLRMLDMVIEATKAIASNQQQIIGLQEELTRHRTDERAYQDEIREAIKALQHQQTISNNILEQAKGGWRVMVAVGGGTSAITLIASWLITHLPPPFGK